MITEKQAEQIIEQLTRIANALDKTPVPVAEPVVQPVPADRPRKFYGCVPAFATCKDAPSYSRCNKCNAEIMWENTPNGWRSYDPTSPFPLHNCKKRAAQDTADLLPGNPNTPPTQ